MLTMNMTVTVMAVLVSSVLARSTMDEWPNFLSCSTHNASRYMKVLRLIKGVTRRDRLRNADIYGA